MLLSLNLKSGETLDYTFDNSKYFKTLLDKAGVHHMKDNQFYKKHSSGHEDAHGKPITPTAMVKGMAGYMAKGGNDGKGEDPLFNIYTSLASLADGGRMIVQIDGGTYTAEEPKENLPCLLYTSPSPRD